jgi:aliphatic aldoxime dehydratase
MESAIPKHLECQRTRHRRVANDYIPPYPATVARYKPEVKQAVMAYFGVQYREASVPDGADQALKSIASAFGGDERPGLWDRAHYVDEAGSNNIISVGYWAAPTKFDAWFGRCGASWANPAVAEGTVGTFIEALRPSIERFETLFSSNDPEGVACLANGFSDVVQEHAYWGGARDRIPMSQIHDMAPAGAPRVVGSGLHQTIVPHENVSSGPARTGPRPKQTSAVCTLRTWSLFCMPAWIFCAMMACRSAASLTAT